MSDHSATSLNRAVVVGTPVALIDPRRQRVSAGDFQKEILVVVELRGQAAGSEQLAGVEAGVAADCCVPDAGAGERFQETVPTWGSCRDGERQEQR